MMGTRRWLASTGVAVALCAGVLLAAPALGSTPPAMATLPLAAHDDAFPPRVHSDDWVTGAALDDDALYMATASSGSWTNTVWRRPLVAVDGGLVVGSPVPIGTTPESYFTRPVDVGPGGALWYEGGARGGTAGTVLVGGDLVLETADGVRRPLGAMPPTTPGESNFSIGDGWYAAGGELRSLAGTTVVDLASIQLPEYFVERSVREATLSSTVAVWYMRNHTGGGAFWSPLVAAPLDPVSGLGPAVMLSVSFAPHDVSDEAVAWVEGRRSEDGSARAVRWVTTADLRAQPHEVVRDTYSVQTDGDRVAIPVGMDGRVAVELYDVADGSLVDVVPGPPSGGGSLLDMRDGLLLWGTIDDPVRARGPQHLYVTTLDGAPLPVLQGFPDVIQNPIGRSIDWLTAAGIATGYADGTFRPTAPVSRQAMAAFLYRAAGSPAWEAPTESPFADVGPASPFYAEVTWLADRGITTGYDGPGDSVLFRPTAEVSRQAMAAFLHRFAEVEADPGEVSPFVDVPTDHGFYAEIAWLADAGISTGTEVAPGAFAFRPTSPVSRQAMAAFLHRLDGVIPDA